MDIFRLHLLVILIFSLVGCAETKSPNNPYPRPYPKKPYYKEVIRWWVGKPLNKLVRDWGAPTKTYRTNTIKFVIYHHQMRHSPIYIRGSGFQWKTAYCIYTFELSKKDIILRVSAEGWACPLYEDEIDEGIILGTTRPK